MGGGGGQSPANWLLSWQLAVSIDLSPITKILTRPSLAEDYLGHEDPPSRCVAHRFRFSIGGVSWHQHIKDPGGNNLQRGGQNGGAVLTWGVTWGRQVTVKGQLPVGGLLGFWAILSLPDESLMGSWVAPVGRAGRSTPHSPAPCGGGGGGFVWVMLSQG